MSMKRPRSSSSDERPRDPPKAESTLSGLCSTCSTMEWSLLAEKSKKNQPVDGFNEAVTKSHEQLQGASCGVCQLLSLLRGPDLDDVSCNLQAMSSYRRFTGRKTLPSPPQPNPSILSIVPEGSKPLTEWRQLGRAIAFEPSLQASSFVDPQHFDHENVNFELIAEWMAACVDDHPECKSDIPSSTEVLEVIDCTNPECMDGKKPATVDLPPGCKYAALSYVWGDVKDNFPQVVKDSVKVVSKLDCKYLWVDRLCIPQEVKGSEERRKKKRLIGRMDEIYSHAKFTIVAAAGQDSNYGLAGITHSRKPELRYAHVPGARLTYLGTPPGEKIRSTLWASRGWTYQEGFLSQRRIFFTDEQVIFQCNTMTCLESFRIPKSVLRQPNNSKRRTDPFLVDIDPISLARQDIGKHLMEFSNRALSQDGDTLKAFLGVLNYFRKEYRCFHLYGNPIPVEDKKGHLINAWYHTKPGVRNAGFPSWSWTGWKGEIKTISRSTEYGLRVFRTRQRARRRGEHRVGHPMSLDDYKEACSTNAPQDMEPIIELTGMMANMSFEVIKWNSESMPDGPWAMIPKTGDTTYYSFLYLDNEALTGIRQFKLPVIVLQSGKKKPNDDIIILALREKSERRFERVGMIILRRGGNEVKAKLTMCRDKSGEWTEPEAQIPKLQEFSWWRKARDQIIELQ